jgi:hypothetical protein
VLALSATLLGSAPALTAQWKGATPPLAWIGWLYGVSNVPLGNAAVVIAIGIECWVGPPPQYANAINNVKTVTYQSLDFIRIFPRRGPLRCCQNLIRQLPCSGRAQCERNSSAPQPPGPRATFGIAWNPLPQ